MVGSNRRRDRDPPSTGAHSRRQLPHAGVAAARSLLETVAQRSAISGAVSGRTEVKCHAGCGSPSSCRWATNLNKTKQTPEPAANAACRSQNLVVGHVWRKPPILPTIELAAKNAR